MINLIKNAVHYIFGKPNAGFQEILKAEIKEKNEREKTIEHYKSKDVIYECEFFNHPIFIDLFYKKTMTYDYKKENNRRKQESINLFRNPVIFFASSLLALIFCKLFLNNFFAIISIISCAASFAYITYIFIEKFYFITIENLDDSIGEIILKHDDYIILSDYFNKTSINKLQHYNSSQYRWRYSFTDIITKQYTINGPESVWIKDSLHNNEPEFKNFIIEKNQTDELYKGKS